MAYLGKGEFEENYSNLIPNLFNNKIQSHNHLINKSNNTRVAYTSTLKHILKFP